LWRFSAISSIHRGWGFCFLAGEGRVARDDEEKVAEDPVPMSPDNAGSLVDEGSGKKEKKRKEKNRFFFFLKKIRLV
jgi:hypothetical protein